MESKSLNRVQCNVVITYLLLIYLFISTYRKGSYSLLIDLLKKERVKSLSRHKTVLCK